MKEGNKLVFCYEVVKPNFLAWNASEVTVNKTEKLNEMKESDGTKVRSEKKSKSAFNFEKIANKIHSIQSNDSSSNNDSLSLEKNILAKITRSKVPLVESDSLSQAEREYAQSLPGSEVIGDNAPTSTAPVEKIALIHISSKNFESDSDSGNIPSFPIALPEDKLKNQIITWNYDPLKHGFEATDKSGEFRVKYHDIDSTEAPLRQNCEYYSRLLFVKPENYDTIFEINSSASPEGCTVIAPLLLHGNSSQSGSFLWNGSSTLFLRSRDPLLSKENELSLHTKNHNLFLNAKNINGVLSLSNEIIWNGALPAFFEVNNFGWPSTNQSIAYPVFWSGVYDGSDFEGNFLIVQKSHGGYLSWDGMFKIDVSTVKDVEDIIHPYHVYQSVVYLTEDTTFDVPEFNEIEDWEPQSTSQIILIGKFEGNKFFWTGDVTLILPRNPPFDPAPSSYRPHGKYLIELVQGTLFASLGHANPIIKWWSGDLPPKVIIPATFHDQRMYKVLFDEAIIWSYDPSDLSFGHGKFKTHGNESQLYLFGNFEFNVTNFFEDIWTVQLQPNVTYYSPLILQENKLVNDMSSDLVEAFYELRKPEAGVFAPIMLLGEYVEKERSLFKWNLKGIITIEE